MAEAIIKGGCLCGAVRYQFTGRPVDLTNCHCTTCRRASAAPFVAWATVASSVFAFSRGKPTFYASSKRAVRSFCGRCGTPLTFQLNDQPDEIDITICSLDQPELFPPKDHIWTRSQLPWIDLADGLPEHRASRGSS